MQASFLEIILHIMMYYILYSIFFYTDTLYWDSLTTCEGGFTCQILTKPSELLTKHGFVYRGCATPIVSSFSPFNIYAGSKITVSSPVLANCVDQLMINVGGADCTQPVQDINDSESIECDLSEEQVISAGLLTGQPLKPCISHNHLGFALLHVSTNEFEQYAFFGLELIVIKHMVKVVFMVVDN